MCVNPSDDMPEAVLGLGGNLGARRAIFRAAVALLDAQPGCRVLARSRLYETPPLGPPQPDYLNAAVRVRFAGEVELLFELAQYIETLLGRERRERWGARTLDIDVLHWSAGPVQSASLEVPHRELAARSFALAPLLDVAPELASQWAPTLAALGGPPPLAQPSWPALARDGAYLCGTWFAEHSELASQLVELLGAREPVVARIQEALARHIPLTTHAFTGPSELFDADGRSWLCAAVDAALERGFAVQMAAVLGRDETHCSGVLLGFDGTEPALPGPHELLLESRGPGEARLKMREDSPRLA
ncbi:MAG: 2-amino-4-hydroxy-6-hydroxymethyldihydropteridine pyrophosphokinae [Myxococcaceae bacterium]|nr:2-amino-4-hydroxy-6-hydroxymethyldihydropteridine pyrophosphokinae [Myxococcaceae bacterium]